MILVAPPYLFLYIYHLPKRHMMSNFTYSFINFCIHHSFSVTFWTPSVFAYFYSVANKRTSAASGVQLAQQTSGGFFHFRRSAFSSMIKSRVSLILAKASDLRINLNLDGAPITSTSHTHLTHSQTQTSRLLTSSLSLGVPVPRPTQCM